MTTEKYKVVLTIKPDLTIEQNNFINEKILELEKKLCVSTKDNHTYLFAGNDESDEFGSVSFFYCMLEDFKRFFTQLEYYDFEDGETDVTVEKS